MDLEIGGLGNILHFKISHGRAGEREQKEPALPTAQERAWLCQRQAGKTAGSGQATSENVSKEGQPLESSKAQGHLLERILTRSL